MGSGSERLCKDFSLDRECNNLMKQQNRERHIAETRCLYNHARTLGGIHSHLPLCYCVSVQAVTLTRKGWAWIWLSTLWSFLFLMKMLLPVNDDTSRNKEIKKYFEFNNVYVD